MPEGFDQAESDAITWIIRMRDPAFSEWDGFTLWLEADPRHADIYDRLSLLDEDAAGLVADGDRQRPLAEPAAVRPIARRSVLGWGMAAAAFAAFGGFWLVGPEPGPELQIAMTESGVRRTVELADGSTILMNGGTRLAYAPDARFARLEQGEALFSVEHDAARPFRVEAAGTELVDMGTAFNVTVNGENLTVAVSEGAVVVAPDAAALRLEAGDGVEITEGVVRRRRVDVADVASWREGRLVYADAPLSAVADDLSRNLGIEVRAAPSVAASSFSGVIRLDQPPARLLPVVGRLTGTEARRQGAGWILTRG
ncbi:FecR family protein [Parasphingopyxis marina]|uniref:FecR domain-containing protein n=1 Tax=Parasphingopyxis marina TaxID=2761622 RepID=A0A842HUN5_9SPHN|nr:FecR domain-containing protein [Parasphingopyxis marina]MBC2776645.1 FecR domain-containing protein [Parasphingopyxis marina]